MFLAVRFQMTHVKITWNYFEISAARLSAEFDFITSEYLCSVSMLTCDNPLEKTGKGCSTQGRQGDCWLGFQW